MTEREGHILFNTTAITDAVYKLAYTVINLTHSQHSLAGYPTTPIPNFHR